MISSKLRRELPLYGMLVPAAVISLIFAYGPMFGIIMAFQKYIPAFGFLKSKWVGLDNFKYILSLQDTFLVIRNTLFIAGMKIVFITAATILVALLLNEIHMQWFKRWTQTIIYIPSFLSWIILGGIFRDFLGNEGIVNKALEVCGLPTVMFLGEAKIFPYILVLTEAWQTVGFGTIIYLAAITSISPTLYEAAFIDGAGRFQQARHITLPGMKPIIVLAATLSLGGLLGANFDQIFVLYNPMVYSTGDVIDTFVYRLGIVEAQFSLATAVGLFRSLVGFILISTSYYLAYKHADYRIF